MKNSTKKIICSVLASVMIFAAVSLVITPKSTSDKGGTMYCAGQGFRAEPENTLDVMMFGNSDAYAGFVPAKLYKDYGYTSYVSGAALQNIGNINELLTAALQKQTPSVIILEVDCLYEKDLSVFDKISAATPLFQYHSRWKSLHARDFYTVPKRAASIDVNKGYVFSSTVKKVSDTDYMGSPNSAPVSISKKALRETESFIKKCEDKNIKVVFVEMPSVVSWSYGKHNYVKSLADKHGIDFWDLNIKSDGYKVNFDCDFRDNGDHLNIKGAEKATAYIGEQLVNAYGKALDNSDYGTVPGWEETTRTYAESL